ncbi:MAG: DnaA/Hda family protein, partial [Pseudomonadota bacterium]
MNVTGVGAARAYELVRRELLSEFGADFFRSYIDPMRFLAEEDGVVLFKAGSAVAQERLRQQAQHRIEARLRAHLPRLERVDILVDREISDDLRAQADSSVAEIGRTATPGPHPLSYTFEHLCVDQTNYRPVTVGRMIATGAGMAFPIVLIHSPPGCGKTHLLHAMAHEAAAVTPDRKVLLMSGQEFLESFQSALHKKRDSSAFKDMVRAPDLLLIDDFQAICGKKATEEEAFHTIRSLTERGRQVVLTANHSAGGLGGLDERLRDTLKAATSCEILEPGAALRRQILESRMKHHARIVQGFSVAPAALDMIADRMPVTGRELDGAISQLVIEAKISGGMEVSLETAENALQDKLADVAQRRVTVQLVQKVTARYYNMTVPQLLERTRRNAVARPRQVAMYLATKLTRASLPDIGDRFGGFDHTTIMYARDRVHELLAKDGIKARIVTAPSLELFAQQDAAYRKSVLGTTKVNAA